MSECDKKCNEYDYAECPGTNGQCIIEREPEATLEEDYINALNSLIEQSESDCLTLALRLHGEDPETFSPETREVMERWKERIEEAINKGGA